MNIDKQGRIPIYSGTTRVGYSSARQAYKNLMGESVKWSALRAMLNEDRVLESRLIVAAHDQQQPSDGPSVAEWVDTYLKDKANNGAAQTTVAIYEQAGRVLSTAFAGRSVAGLERKDGRELRDRLVAQDKAIKGVMKARRSGSDWSDRYIASILSRCRSILSDAVEEGYLKANPLRGITVKAGPTEGRQRVERDEAAELIERLIREGRTAWAAALTLCRFVGARRGEMLAVQSEDVLVEQQAVRLHNIKTRKHKAATRMVPISEDAMGWLRPCLGGGAVVNLTLSEAKQIKSSLGVGWTWQALRASWASDAVAGAASPGSYIKASGHSAKIAAEFYWQAREQDADGLRV